MYILHLVYFTKVSTCDKCNEDCKSVSRAGHAFGAITGLMIGIVILKNRKVEKWEMILQIIAFTAFCLFVIVLILWHLFGGPSWFTAMNAVGSISCESKAYCTSG